MGQNQLLITLAVLICHCSLACSWLQVTKHTDEIKRQNTLKHWCVKHIHIFEAGRGFVPSQINFHLLRFLLSLFQDLVRALLCKSCHLFFKCSEKILIGVQESHYRGAIHVLVKRVWYVQGPAGTGVQHEITQPCGAFMLTVLCTDMAELNFASVHFTRRLQVHLISRSDPEILQLQYGMKLSGVECAAEVKKHDFHKTVCLF